MVDTERTNERTNEQTKAELDDLQTSVGALKNELAKVIVGQDEVVEQVMIGLFAGGHVLLEGVPGLGKTLLVRTLSRALDLEFARVQFTPDLMPADITGTNIVVEDPNGRRSFEFQRGPVFANVVLADEINRATPKTQSALLEAMQESTVTISGRRHELPAPFYVLATQNPIEMEGTYPLPEAQLDRFLFKVLMPFPDRAELVEVLDRTTGRQTSDVKAVLDGKRIRRIQELVREVILAGPVTEYAASIVLATHADAKEAPESVKQFLRYGSSPRGGQSIILAAKVRALLDGRYNVAFDDIRQVAKPCLRHRVILNFEGEAEGRSADDVLDDVLAAVKE